ILGRSRTLRTSSCLGLTTSVSYCPATTTIYTLSLHDALPISIALLRHGGADGDVRGAVAVVVEDRYAFIDAVLPAAHARSRLARSEEHTSELQSLAYLVCRLLLEKKNTARTSVRHSNCR